MFLVNWQAPSRVQRSTGVTAYSQPSFMFYIKQIKVKSCPAVELSNELNIRKWQDLEMEKAGKCDLPHFEHEESAQRI